MILTRYLASHIHKGTALVLLALVGISLFFTLIQELGDLGSGQYGMTQLFQYLLLKLPHNVVQFMPLATLLGCMLSLGSLAGNSELIAMQSSGLSVKQLMVSVTQSVLVLAILSLLISEYIVPFSETRAKAVRSGSLSSSISVHARKGVWIKDDNKVIYIQHLFPDGNAQDIKIYHLNAQDKVVRTTQAQKALVVSNGWQLNNIKQTQFINDEARVSVVNQQLYQGTVSETLLASLVVDPQQMSVSGLKTYINFLRDNQLNANAESLAFWRKLYTPLSIIVMGLLAIPFVLGSQRQTNTGQRLMIGILLGLFYVLVNRLLIQLGEQLNVVAYINALIPTLLFMLMSAGLIYRKTVINR